MNILDTLCFPDTVLSPSGRLSLAVLFDSLHLLQPVEAETDSVQEPPLHSANGYPFMETEFCQVHTPSKLGGDRERFLHLLHDIQNRKDNYVEQLSYLSLASFSERAGQGDGQRHTIISSLLQGVKPDVAETGDGLDRESLWQARLVLKIAEQLDREEEELTRQMAVIDDREIALFRNLQGELKESGDGDGVEEDPFRELLELRQKMNLPRPGMMKNRLRAWSRLYRSGELPQALPVWTTRRQEVAEIVLDQYEQECKKLPIRLLALKLPARFETDLQDELQGVTEFRALLQPLRQKLAESLTPLMEQPLPADSDPEALAPWAGAWAEEWASGLEVSFPASEYGRVGLTLYLLPGMLLSTLMGRAEAGVQDEWHNGLLAVCG